MTFRYRIQRLSGPVVLGVPGAGDLVACFHEFGPALRELCDVTAKRRGLFAMIDPDGHILYAAGALVWPRQARPAPEPSRN